MADGSAISWTDATWNPTRGCRRVSPGCEHCYAERQANRFKGPGKAYEGLVKLVSGKPRWTGATTFAVDQLAQPLSWRQPRRIFVDSMSDLFYEGFSNEQIAAVFGVMAACPQHTFQILTKRAARMREWFEWMTDALPMKTLGYDPRALACWDFTKIAAPHFASSAWDSDFMSRGHLVPWPLPNIWLGVSVENQAAADERIPELLATPAAVRFLSCEPLLSAVALTHIGKRGDVYLSALEECVGHIERPRIDWVIAGCESGPGARPCSVEWLRSLRDQCGAAGVPLFLKQATAVTGGAIVDGIPVLTHAVQDGDGSKIKGGGVIELPYLDGKQHAAFPTVTP